MAATAGNHPNATGEVRVMNCANYYGQECDDLCGGNGCRVIWRTHTLDEAGLAMRFRRKAENDSSWWMYA